MNFLKISISLLPILSFALLEISILNSSLFFLISSLSLLLIIALSYFVSGKLNKKKLFFHVLVLPFLFLFAVVLFTLISTSSIIIHFLFIFASVYLYLYFKNIYYFFSSNDSVYNISLENISSYGNLILIFLFFSSIYALQSFLNIDIWILILVIISVVYLVLYQVLWINNISTVDNYLFIIMGCFVISQIAWSISFLPFSYNILGLILAICYYVLVGSIRFYLKGNFKFGIIKYYLTFGVLSILILLLTSKWMQ